MVNAVDSHGFLPMLHHLLAMTHNVKLAHDDIHWLSKHSVTEEIHQGRKRQSYPSDRYALMKDSLAWLISGVLLIVISYLLVRATDSPLPPHEGTEEKHLQNLKQLTSGGQNAEAYFSFDGSKIIFQSTRPPYQCDQIFSMNVDGSDLKLLSTRKGRTTCGFFFPDGKRFLYASTHLAGDNCP